MKKNLTEEERKELKENLKKQIDGLSDEELDNVVGGMKIIVIKDNGNLPKILPKILPTPFALKRCPYCQKKFFREEDCSSHIQKEHPEVGESIQE